MRLLIDGYNVMHAAGLMARRFGPDGLRRARRRFLNDLARRLGPERAGRTTVVFDAATLPLNESPRTSHKGMAVIFAVEDEDADARIEHLIARHSAPKGLTVVSTDHRIRRAATRRRARAITADAFLDQLDEPAPPARPVEPPPVPDPLGDPSEVAHWLEAFSGAGPDADAPLDDPSGAAPFGWSDAELARVAREVEGEPDLSWPPARR